MDFPFKRALNSNDQIWTKREDFMIHVLNNLPEEYDVILDGLENHLMATGENALTVDSIHEKLNHRYEKIKS